jgi:drug/metabolite transporter (DMT)-like permease
MLSTDEKDYSDYLKHLSNVINIMSLCSGFLFTAYTILITRLPDPSIITAQLTLLILSIYLSICLFCLGYFASAAFSRCRNLPPLSKGMTITNALFFVAATTAMSVVTTLMSLLWNLTYLALVQTIQWILFVVAIYLSAIRPGWKYRKAKSSE